MYVMNNFTFKMLRVFVFAYYVSLHLKKKVKAK